MARESTDRLLANILPRVEELADVLSPGEDSSRPSTTSTVNEEVSQVFNRWLRQSASVVTETLAVKCLSANRLSLKQQLHQEAKRRPVQVKEKLEEEIVNANAEFSELQSKMISEKENRETKNEKSNEKDLAKVSVADVVSQEKQVEDTTNDLANL